MPSAEVGAEHRRKYALNCWPVGPVIDPLACGGDPFAGADGSGMTDHGDQVAMAAGLHPEHTEAVLDVVERHALDEAGEDPAVGCLDLVARFGVLQDVPSPSQWLSLLWLTRE